LINTSQTRANVGKNAAAIIAIDFGVGIAVIAGERNIEVVVIVIVALGRGANGFVERSNGQSDLGKRF